MTHKFQPINMKKLDSEWRRQNLPPLATLEKLGLMAEDIAADIGCGIGYFTIPIAEITNNMNKVYALDTSEQMLMELEKRAKTADAANVVAIKTDEYDLKLPDNSVTLALLVNVLHEIDDKDKFIQEIKRILKTKGRIAIVEWKKETMEMGPSVSHRISEDEVNEIMKANGFVLNKQIQFAEMFYGMVFDIRGV